MHRFLLAVLLTAVPGMLASAQAQGVPTAAPPRDLRLFNGDLEMPAATGPPPGWAMWGADRFKDPSNYTRDTENPHGGSACLRILHPAATDGYLVTDPARAIRPRAGMAYTVTFWARGDKPGTSGFGFTAYASLSPYTDAPSPGAYDLKVGTDWQPYSFTIRDGNDFFIDTCRYLLLTFDAARDHAEARTLYVDDIKVTEQPSGDPHPLLNLNTIPHASLQHRLAAGTTLDFTVNAGAHERRATRMAEGVSFHRLVGFTGAPYDKTGKYTLDPQLERAIHDMRLPMTRLYGVGEEPFGLEGAIDRVVDLCAKIGVPQEGVVLELEDELADRAQSPERWARAVRYCRSKHYRFRYWEVSNEPYSSLWHVAWAPTGQAFPTPEAYIAHLKAVSAAIHREQPDAQVGANVSISSLPWGNRVLREAAGSYDFVVPHYYSSANVNAYGLEDLALTANYQLLDLTLRVNALIRAYNPHRTVYQFDTEWGMISNGPAGQEADDVPRNANVIGLVHRAVRLIYYTREGMLRGASSWQMLSNVQSPGFGILSPQAPDKRFLLYWLSYYFNRHVGEWVLPISGTAPFQTEPGRLDGGSSTPAGPLTPVLATSSADGRTVYLVIANGSASRSVPLKARIRGFSAGKVEAVVISQPSLDSSPLLERKEDAVGALDVHLAGGFLTATLPAHSVSFITVTSGGGTRGD